MVFHNHIDKVINRSCAVSIHESRLEGWLTIFISNKYFTIQHLVVSQNIIQHLLIKVLWRILERDFHPASLLLFEINIAESY